MDPIEISCGPIDIKFNFALALSMTPRDERNADLDITYELEEDDCIELGTISIEGLYLNQSITALPIDLLIDLLGNAAVSQYLTLSPINLTLTIRGSIAGQSTTTNWVAWSKIGQINFTIDESNESGRLAMEWPGRVYDILKLGLKSAVVYGSGGISLMTPVDKYYSRQNIHNLGITGKGAIVGNEFEHFFIDQVNKLYRLTEQGKEELDYSEYISSLGTIKMSLNYLNGLLYICDGSKGYVYNYKAKSFGEGPTNISGLGVKISNLYSASPSTIYTPKFQITTDIYDLGSRKSKTIRQLEIGTDLINSLEARIDARYKNNTPFYSTGWKLINPSGIVDLPCFGVEFKFNLRSEFYEYFEIDYIKVIGELHQYSYFDMQG